MEKLLLVGGGRWARVLLSVLIEILPAECQIVWVTRYGRAVAETWCQSRQLSNIQVHEHLSEVRLSDAAQGPAIVAAFDGAVVATSPHQHADTVRTLLHAHIPTLCEKPFVLDVQQAEQLEHLAKAQNTLLGVNLELHYASYLERLHARSGNLPRGHIAIQWLDPWSEQRYGETKYSDVFTSIVHDMFAHCWSLLRRVSGRTQWHVCSVTLADDTSVTIELEHGGLSASICLSRRAAQRTRTISLNDGLVLLDFSIEPGWIERESRREILNWETSRPLTRSLQSFLNLLDNRALNKRRCPAATDSLTWPLNVSVCREAVRLSTEIAADLLQQQWQRLHHIIGGRGPVNDELRQQLIFDIFVPLAAQCGRRVEFTEPARLAEFVAEVEQRLASGCQLHDFFPAQPIG